MSCPAFERPISFITDLLNKEGFILNTTYNKPEVVSQIKDYIRAFVPNPEPFREATDKFLLFQNAVTGVLVEASGECSKFYIDFTSSTFREFIAFFGNTL